jgi:LemA protein
LWLPITFCLQLSHSRALRAGKNRSFILKLHSKLQHQEYRNMSPPLIIGILTLVVITIVIAYFYNRLVRGRLLVREAFSGMDVQLKRRHDLIPNLVSTVQGYAAFEKSVLADLTRLRSQASGATAINERQAAESGLAAAMGKLFAVAENYPDLKADSQFLELQQQLSEVEDAIQKSRRYYNGTVRDYNITAESFPALIFASLFSFRAEPFFQLAEENQRAVPPIQFEQQG